MSRFLQNILYIIIALAIYYGVSAYFKVDFEPKSNAIYLPETYTHYRPTNIDNIKVYSLDKSGEANKSKIYLRDVKLNENFEILNFNMALI